MSYKFSLGAKLMPRQQYLDHVWSVRESKGHIILPVDQEALNAKSLIDQLPFSDALQSKLEMNNTNNENKPAGKDKTQHSSPTWKDCLAPEKKRSKNTQSDTTD